MELKTLVWRLRPDCIIQISLPFDFNKADLLHLKKLLKMEAELYKDYHKEIIVKPAERLLEALEENERSVL